MYKINKVRADHVIDFAAEELKKYLRMMMPRCGEIDIEYKPDAEDGYRLGLMQDFGIDTSEAEDTELDDILHIDTDDNGGIIAGSNPRSVLLAVYQFLRENGCRWLYPGVDGEYIPMTDVKGVKFHKMPDMRYRGQCNEGAEYQQSVLESIDFTPKIGMNIFMIEFDIPKGYYNTYYDHSYNTENREPEPITAETVLQWKRQCEAEISKRGLQFHDMGHGWTAESFGINSTEAWSVQKDNPIPEESKQFVAMINGERKLFGGVALNTNFCMSNAEARAKVVKYVADYSELNRHVDYLHVWLADFYNNHCECEECSKMTPTEWYIMLLNEIDEELTVRGLDTRIVFCCYYETIWVSEKVKLNNPKRFSMLLAAITRSYLKPVSTEAKEFELKPYERNNITLPRDIDEYIVYAKKSMDTYKVRSLVYEYHFCIHQSYSPGQVKYAKLLQDDVRGYYAQGMDGIIEDGTQRNFFPNGFAMYAYARTMFDTKVDFEELKEDYFSHAYGKDWREVAEFLEKMDTLFDAQYMWGRKSANLEVGRYYNPAMADSLRKVHEELDAFEPFVQAHKNMPMRVQTVSMRLLWRFLEYAHGVANVFTLKCFGAGKEALDEFNKFLKEFGKYEIELERYYDHFMLAAHGLGCRLQAMDGNIPIV